MRQKTQRLTFVHINYLISYICKLHWVINTNPVFCSKKVLIYKIIGTFETSFSTFPKISHSLPLFLCIECSESNLNFSGFNEDVWSICAYIWNMKHETVWTNLQFIPIQDRISHLRHTGFLIFFSHFKWFFHVKFYILLCNIRVLNSNNTPM